MNKALSPKTRFPSTRFQGSKVRLLPWFEEVFSELSFHSVLDAFGGTGSVSYLLKQMGKQVTYNDALRFNSLIGAALLENDFITLTLEEVDALMTPQSGRSYPTWIFDTFPDIYYTDLENRWLDMVVTHIGELSCRYKQSLAFFALFQACLAKRPFNLFHRKNLYLRLAKTSRSFGNKVTWDTPFETLFRRYVEEANQAVFGNGFKHQALNQDMMDLEEDYDLVYLDPPYISGNGAGVDYYGFYHFLEGLCDYANWPERVDTNSLHKRMKKEYSPWADKNAIEEAFDQAFQKFRKSTIVVSYRADGIPDAQQFVKMMCKYKNDVLFYKREHTYALSKKQTEEVLVIGR